MNHQDQDGTMKPNQLFLKGNMLLMHRCLTDKKYLLIVVEVKDPNDLPIRIRNTRKIKRVLYCRKVHKGLTERSSYYQVKAGIIARMKRYEHPFYAIGRGLYDKDKCLPLDDPDQCLIGLRIDNHCEDDIHVTACRYAAMAYYHCIMNNYKDERDDLRQIACKIRDMVLRFNREGSEPEKFRRLCKGVPLPEVSRSDPVPDDLRSL